MKTPLERFSEKYIITDTDCWQWTGVLGGSDFKYGYIYCNTYKRKIPAVRFSYEMFIGGIPEDHNVKRSCKNSLCVNPDHLYVEKKILNTNGISRFNEYLKSGNNFQPGWDTGASRKRFVISLKTTAGCDDCGQDFLDYPNVLDFDHRLNEIKEFNIGGVSGSSHSWESLVNEIMKCDVVCSNCHRIRTAKRSRKEVI